MYYNCKSLEKIPDIPYWNLQNVKNMSYMFFGCEKIREIPKQFNDEEIIRNKDVSYMIYGCKQFFLEVYKKRSGSDIIKNFNIKDNLIQKFSKAVPYNL